MNTRVFDWYTIVNIIGVMVRIITIYYVIRYWMFDELIARPIIILVILDQTVQVITNFIRAKNDLL